MGLSDAAKPQNGYEEFFVARSEFKEAVVEATITVEGFTRSALAGDPHAQEFLNISKKIEAHVDRGHRVINGVENDMASGTVTEDSASVGASLLANIVLEIQTELLAGKGYGSL